MKHLRIIEADQLLETANPKIIEAQLIDYIMSLRNDGLSYATMKHMLAPILTFYQINDVLLNRKKISRYFGECRRVAFVVIERMYALSTKGFKVLNVRMNH